MSDWFVWVVDCPGDPEELTRTRRFVHQILSRTPWADDAALIVTELATNAITHTDSGKTTFRLSITRTPEALTIAVTDAGGTATKPRVTHPDADSSHGRGLAIVSALATTLTIRGDQHGHTITVRLGAGPRQP
ncbi:ATP-binding protein [Streptomyces sp. 8K308]|uniref:ATP-binding protein n=1 Tax=Streptomyces sp. 8K308 TaxID=2530388 RepID=UPI001FB73A1E|nr:ATP-binding protein [Streptomyces sp. 8K308]